MPGPRGDTSTLLERQADLHSDKFCEDVHAAEVKRIEQEQEARELRREQDAAAARTEGEMPAPHRHQGPEMSEVMTVFTKKMRQQRREAAHAVRREVERLNRSQEVQGEWNFHWFTTHFTVDLTAFVGRLVQLETGSRACVS